MDNSGIALNLSLTLALDGGGWSTSRPGGFKLGRRADAHRMGAENLASTGIPSPHRPGRSKSLYRLRYPGPYFLLRLNSIICILFYNTNVTILNAEL